jgi:hypothetical protein
LDSNCYLRSETFTFPSNQNPPKIEITTLHNYLSNFQIKNSSQLLWMIHHLSSFVKGFRRIFLRIFPRTFSQHLSRNHTLERPHQSFPRRMIQHLFRVVKGKVLENGSREFILRTLLTLTNSEEKTRTTFVPSRTSHDHLFCQG